MSQFVRAGISFDPNSHEKWELLNIYEAVDIHFYILDRASVISCTLGSDCQDWALDGCNLHGEDIVRNEKILAPVSPSLHPREGLTTWSFDGI